MSYAQTHTLALLNDRTNGGTKCENRDLLFSRFTNPGLKDDGRRAFLLNAIARRPNTDSFCGDRCKTYSAFLDTVPGVVRIYAKNQTRLLLNMSGGVLENAGCSLDRLTGLPRIPGSAIKGIARHAALDALKSNHDEHPAKTLADIALTFGWISADWKPDAENADFAWACADHLEEAKETIKQCLGFFSDAYSGSIAFFDALPDKPLRNDLELDIVTSHHKNYYAGKTKIALDNEEPNPVVFPAIAAGHTFGFAIAPITVLSLNHDKLLALCDKARAWLLEGLTIHGIGAKTAAGYGWFENVSDEIDRNKREEARKSEEKRKNAEEERLRQTKEQEKQKRKDEFASLSIVEKLDATISEDVGKFKEVLEKFPEFSLDDKKAVVLWFATGNGKSHWAKVISRKKPFKEPVWGQIEQSIRKTRKDHDLEKLPQ